MLGVLVNTGAIVVGGLMGLALRRGIPSHLSDALQKGIGLCLLVIGMSGAFEGENTLILILSIVFGVLIGEGIDLDRQLNRATQALGKRFRKGVEPTPVDISEQSPERDPAPKKTSIARGFLPAALIFCVGAMAVVGSLESGLAGNHTTLYTKSLLDLITATVLASSLGIGVLFSAAAVFLYQGSIVLLASLLAPLLSATMVAEITCVGSLLIFALGLNMIGLTKFKILNFLPAVFLPLLLCPLYNWILSLF